MQATAEKSGTQAGDPARAAEAMSALTETQSPPVHLVLGAFGLDAVTKNSRPHWKKSRPGGKPASTRTFRHPDANRAGSAFIKPALHRARATLRSVNYSADAIHLAANLVCGSSTQ
jgi:hypothetical protein